MSRALLLSCLLFAAAHAVEPDQGLDEVTADLSAEPALIPGLTPGTPPPVDQVDALAQAISSGLRCPVCQGLSVADSTSAAAVQMHHRVRELVAAGYTRQEIDDYFVSKYGEWVLLEPTRGGLNSIVWIGPLLAAALGLLAALSFVRESDKAAAPPPRPPDDPYAASLLAEVDDD
jgi:cytochrome c-type biogenesis protein CcmH